MLLVVDAGNTAATWGLFKRGVLKASGSAIHIDIPKLAKKCNKNGDEEGLNVVISSVVPKVTLKIKKALKGKKCSIWVVGENLQVPIRHKYKPLKSLGADRIVNVYGGLQRFEPPFLVIDFGTAITFDYVSAEGVFEGGLIVPGPELSFQALIQKAARLPKKARLPKSASSFLGTNTYDCMKSGILEAYGAMADGLVERFKAKFGPMKVIATGGFAKHLKPYTRSFEVLDPLFSVYSLSAIYRNLISKTR